MPTALKAWAVLVAALYALLAYGSYVTLPALAGGFQGFDMRPFGMSGADARAYLDAMTEAGREYYSNWLKPLDTVFLIALALLLLGVSWVLRGVLGVVAGVAAISYAGFDLIENELVLALISFGTKASVGEMVGTISMITTAKYGCLLLSVGTLIWKWRRSSA